MTADELILAVLAGLPKHEIRGKKRLQKLAFFVKQAGVECDASFRLWDYGPFSVEVAKAADWLAALDKIIEQTAQVGELNTFMTIYSMPRDYAKACDLLESKPKQLLQFLDSYSTIELEVAATIRYFENQGLTKEAAIQQTKQMKPTKTTPAVLEKSNEIVQQLN
jgi:uncharacterized protein YwgA